MSNVKPTAELIAWLRIKAEHETRQASFQDDRHNRDYHLAAADKYTQTADRLAECEAAMQHCMDRAQKGVLRTQGHVCDATQECMSIMQKAQQVLQHKDSDNA